MNIEELQKLIQNEDYVKFIECNLNSDTNILRLKNNLNTSFDTKFAILQIECKNRIKKKLPQIYNDNSFIFPNILSTEQCTAQQIAEFHSSLLSENDSVLDMTAGLCIDTFYMSQKVKHVTSLEINEEIAIAAKFNMLNHCKNVSVENIDCINYIVNCKHRYDVIFIDPARRGDNNKRLFGLAECTPNVLDLIPSLKEIGDFLYIKASPMIDITQATKELNNYVTDIWVLGINNECKELLFKVDLNNSLQLQPIIHTINFTNNGTQKISVANVEIKHNASSYHPIDINSFLYEPNSCIMKAGIFSTLLNTYDISQIHPNSHLFINNNLIHDFPGRKFQIIDIIPFKNKEIKSLKNKYPQINVSIRNFKLSAEELKKRLKVNDGGNIYLFGTTDKDNKAILILCHKI